MVWNYFTIEHGKGEVDGINRALLKQELWKEQIKPDVRKLQCT
jgi:hypothetical protein